MEIVMADDMITNAVIEALMGEQDRYSACLGLAASASALPAATLYEADRAAGQSIRDRYGKLVAGELVALVNWVRVGQHFRVEEADG